MSLSDLAVDGEGFAAVIDGELSVLFIGSLEDIGRGHGRFGRFGGGNGGSDDATTSRLFGRDFGGGALTLPPGFSGDRDSLGPLSGFEGTFLSCPKGRQPPNNCPVLGRPSSSRVPEGEAGNCRPPLSLN